MSNFFSRSEVEDFGTHSVGEAVLPRLGGEFRETAPPHEAQLRPYSLRYQVLNLVTRFVNDICNPRDPNASSNQAPDNSS